MSVQTYFESLRAKPDHEKKRFAFWTSFGITALIFVFWLGSFTALGNAAQAPVAAAVQKAGSPGQSLVASVGSLFTDVKELVFGARKMTYSSVEVLPGKK